MSDTQYVKTGVPGVDELLGGRGIPRGSLVFVLGSPGSGKTTFGLQFLYKGALQHNEPGVYVSLDEDLSRLRTSLRGLGIEIEDLEKKNALSLLDASPIRLLPGQVKIGAITLGKREFSMVSLIDAISRAVKQVNAKRLVIDPVATLTIQYPNEVERRTALLDLMQGIVPTGCTTLLISELQETSVERTYQFEEYLAQGVIIMRRILRPGGVLRIFSVEKMRALDHDHQPHPYRIVQGGIEVYPTELAF